MYIAAPAMSAPPANLQDLVVDGNYPEGSGYAPAPSAPPADTVYYAPAPPARGRGMSGLYIALIVLVIVLVAAYMGLFRRGVAEIKADAASDLASQGWFYYSRPGCGYCSKQDEVLGTTEYAYKIVCDGNDVHPMRMLPIPCPSVPAYPYWVNAHTGETRQGLQSATAIAEMLYSGRR